MSASGPSGPLVFWLGGGGGGAVADVLQQLKLDFFYIDKVKVFFVYYNFYNCY